MSRWGNLFGLRKPDKFSLDNLKYVSSIPPNNFNLMSLLR